MSTNPLDPKLSTHVHKPPQTQDPNVLHARILYMHQGWSVPQESTQFISNVRMSTQNQSPCTTHLSSICKHPEGVAAPRGETKSSHTSTNPPNIYPKSQHICFMFVCSRRGRCLCIANQILTPMCKTNPKIRTQSEHTQVQFVCTRHSKFQ